MQAPLAAIDPTGRLATAASDFSRAAEEPCCTLHLTIMEENAGRLHPSLLRLRERRAEPVDIGAGPAYLPPAKSTGARGGIGRRARFRSVFRKEWWFDSTRAHHSPPCQAVVIGVAPPGVSFPGISQTVDCPRVAIGGSLTPA